MARTQPASGTQEPRIGLERTGFPPPGPGVPEQSPGIPGRRRPAPSVGEGLGRSGAHGKAVALARGWPHERHSRFHQVMNQSGQLTGSDRVRLPHGRAEVLHVNFHELSGGLDAEVIGEEVGNMAELLDVLEPLTI